jgi:hypothetical protein
MFEFICETLKDRNNRIEPNVINRINMQLHRNITVKLHSTLADKIILNESQRPMNLFGTIYAKKYG